MKKFLIILAIVVVLICLVGCVLNNSGIKTDGIVVGKEIGSGNVHYLVLNYHIDSTSDVYEAKIKVNSNKYESYNIGDSYTFYRPDR